MNAKQAKALRRQAREFAGEAPTVNSVVLRNGQAINSPYSARGLYRRLKREAQGDGAPKHSAI